MTFLYFLQMFQWYRILALTHDKLVFKIWLRTTTEESLQYLLQTYAILSFLSIHVKYCLENKGMEICKARELLDLTRRGEEQKLIER